MARVEMLIVKAKPWLGRIDLVDSRLPHRSRAQSIDRLATANDPVIDRFAHMYVSKAEAADLRKQVEELTRRNDDLSKQLAAKAQQQQSQQQPQQPPPQPQQPAGAAGAAGEGVTK